MRIIGYHIGERIGDGSYSKVYYAEHQSKNDPKTFSNVPIACKIIDGRYTSSEFLKKFLPRELSIVQRLAHPHIVSIYSIVEQGPFMCCFMDFCAHGDLLDRIRYRGRLSAGRSRQFFSQIAGAVRYLHSLGVAHRDIKCENVLIHRRDSVKLTDFGFARRMEFEQNNVLVLSDTYCGSAAYAAPEVLKGIAYDPRAYDMWSLGCVLYIMVTGLMPFDDQNIAATIKKQERGEVLYPPEVPVPDAVKNIIQYVYRGVKDDNAVW